MPTPTYVALATFTASGGETGVTFGSISGYRDLIVTYDFKTPSDSELRLEYNGDSGSNYPEVIMYNFGASGSDSATATLSYVPTAASPYTEFWGQAQILDASATDKHKTTLVRSNNTGEYVLAYASRWANTNAITSIECYLTTSSFSSGSTINLFGIVS